MYVQLSDLPHGAVAHKKQEAETKMTKRPLRRETLQDEVNDTHAHTRDILPDRPDSPFTLCVYVFVFVYVKRALAQYGSVLLMKEDMNSH